jgi:hypothetical protein
MANSANQILDNTMHPVLRPRKKPKPTMLQKSSLIDKPPFACRLCQGNQNFFLDRFQSAPSEYPADPKFPIHCRHVFCGNFWWSVDLMLFVTLVCFFRFFQS